MEFFVKIVFYGMLICEILRIMWLGCGEYPRETTRFADSISLIINIAIIIWAACLIWR